MIYIYIYIYVCVCVCIHRESFMRLKVSVGVMTLFFKLNISLYSA